LASPKRTTTRGFPGELGEQGRTIDVVIELKNRNINARAATVCRFLRRERERRLLEDGEEMTDAVNTLAERGNKDAGAREQLGPRLTVEPCHQPG